MTFHINARTLVSFAAGLAVAVIAMVVFQAVTADAVGANESTFVPMTPCRLFDTRPGAPNVGPRNTPIGQDSSATFQVTGSNGDCVIPAAATAVAINLTGVSPSAQTNLRMYPTGAAVPNAAVLNMSAGQPPLPNKLDVKLSSSGKVSIYNRFGSIHVIGDVLGYYRHDGLAGLEARLAALEASPGTDPAVAARLAALETLTQPMTLVNTAQSGPTMLFKGVNVQVVNGTNFTNTQNGTGNVIIGYNFRDPGNQRSGSHNLIVGDGHSYGSDSGLIAGEKNTVTASNAFVAGNRNTVNAVYGSVLGGGFNTISSPNGTSASVLGGASVTCSTTSAICTRPLTVTP